MSIFDTDTSQTDWTEFDLPNESERCPITGVTRVSGYASARLSGDSRADERIERRGRSNSKLQAMFDKFLYQK